MDVATLPLYGGHGTAIRTWPGGPGRALMIHCSMGHAGAWKGVAEALTPTHECRAFDLPGHGRSASWSGEGVYQDLVCDIIRDMIAEWEAPVDLVGHSFGATAALRIAAVSPELVRRLVLIEPVFFTAAYAADPDFEAANKARTGPLAEAQENGDWKEAARLFLADWGDGRPWDELDEAQKDHFATMMRLIHAVQITNNGDPEGILAEGKIARMPAPTLLIDGGDSPEASGRIVRALEDMISDARSATIAGAGHMVPISHAAQVAPLVVDFLR